MYPDFLSEFERAKNNPVKKGTIIYIAGFETFVTDEDSTAHEILWTFFKRQYPNSKAPREQVLRCFSDMTKEDTKLEWEGLADLKCFGHVLYL